MVSKDIAILLSTFNGDKYLETQIRSIINQTYQNWILYVRDDGSNDQTTTILKKYSGIDSRIMYNHQDHENLGVSASFFKLLNNAEASYYMFCDQDDFWKKDKVEKTLKFMVNVDNKNIPVLVHTDLSIVDSNLDIIEKSMKHNKVSSNFKDVIFNNSVTGCTVIFNNKLKYYMKNTDPKNIYMHDWWCSLVASYFGKIYFMNQQTILYRQHKNNVVGTNNNIIERVLNKFSSKNIYVLIKRSGLHQLSYFSKLFSHKISKEDKIMIEFLLNIKNKSVINKIRYIKKYQFSSIDFFRTLMLYFYFIFII